MYDVQKFSKQAFVLLLLFRLHPQVPEVHVPEGSGLVVALLLLRNIIAIYNSHNPQTSAPDNRVVGSFVTVRSGITTLESSESPVLYRGCTVPKS